MPRELFICEAVDSPLPDVETYRTQCLLNWVQEHPSVRTMRHNTETVSRWERRHGQQHHVHRIVLTINYTEGPDQYEIMDEGFA